MLFSIAAKEIIVYVLFKPKTTLRVSVSGLSWAFLACSVSCNLATDKWLISKIYKQLIYLNIKKAIKSKNGQKT